MVNDHSRGYLQNCCYSKQLSMALLHASHPQIRLVGVRTSYIYISWTVSSGPHYKSLFGPRLGCTLLQSVSLPSCSPWFICTQTWDCLLCQQTPCLLCQAPFPLPHSSTAFMLVLFTLAAHLCSAYCAGYMFF